MSVAMPEGSGAGGNFDTAFYNQPREKVPFRPWARPVSCQCERKSRKSQDHSSHAFELHVYTVAMDTGSNSTHSASFVLTNQ
ncbi:hypothetical protein Bbelb_078880, partial [Branchiostoma belcheri]